MHRHLLAAALLLAAVNIGVEALDFRPVAYLTKPLATLAIVVFVLRSAPATRYRAWITAGLLASLSGDILLMLPLELFVAGLLAFLVAHACYIAAFAGDGGGWRAPKRPALVVYGTAAAMLAFLWPSLGAMRVPVALYVAVIATMAWQATARWLTRRTAGALGAAVGSWFFLVSDSALAVNRFAVPFRGAAIVILLTYYVAQWGIARSTSEPGAS
jgi:uncharacterized membrane protein YhhN